MEIVHRDEQAGWGKRDQAAAAQGAAHAVREILISG